MINSVHRRAQNSYKSTNFNSPAPGWLMSSLVLAAQQAGKGEPPCLPAKAPFPPSPKVLPAAQWALMLVKQKQG